MPTVKAILGYLLFQNATEQEDQEENTDLRILDAAGVRIGVRIRRYKYWCNRRYRTQFTLRYSRPSGAKTEYQKILEKWGDLFFYGFAGKKASELVGWGLLDLAIFREWAQDYRRRNGRVPGARVFNPADGTEGRAIGWLDVPREAIRATWPRDVASGIAQDPGDWRRAVQVALAYTQEEG